MSAITVADLEGALARREFTYWYQPKISMVLGTLCGAEALIRWRRGDQGLVPPGAFIPLAEESGFITEITLGMLDTFARDTAALEREAPGLITSFNASARDIEDGRLLEALERRIERGELVAEATEVELTESAVIVADASFRGRLNRLRAHKVHLAMDDFGTGYSSIETLSALPFTAVKIDQGLVRRMEQSEKDATLVETSIRMGHRLGVEVVAEGIETEGVYRRLQAAGCGVGQGYWMGRPMPLPELLALAASGRSWPGGARGLVHMATLDHLEWRKALVDELLMLPPDREVPASFLRFAADSSECRLGRWYHGPGRQLAALEVYQDLAAPHDALHACGARIVAAARRGARVDDLLRELDELSLWSTQVIGCLHGVEHAMLLGARSLRQACSVAPVAVGDVTGARGEAAGAPQRRASRAVGASTSGGSQGPGRRRPSEAPASAPRTSPASLAPPSG
ncbi:MAG: EAL domain-containing protein [Deltaproteobacteria bacterium]|nr:EAL domain-containing protein [Deltaproteobacteria bacterium]